MSGRTSNDTPPEWITCPCGFRPRLATCPACHSRADGAQDERPRRIFSPAELDIEAERAAAEQRRPGPAPHPDRERYLRRLRDVLCDAEYGRNGLSSLAATALRWALTELDPGNPPEPPR